MKKTITPPSHGHLKAEMARIHAIVEAFSEEMSEAMLEKALEGYTGWDDPANAEVYYNKLLAHAAGIRLAAGHERDIANFAMILWALRTRPNRFDVGPLGGGDIHAPDEVEFVEVPVLDNFDSNKLVGSLRIRKDALPENPNFVFSLGVRCLEKIDSEHGLPPTYTGPYSLECVSPISVDDYIGYLRQVHLVPEEGGQS